MPPWSLQNSQYWLIFSHVEKDCQKKIFFLCRATSTPWATHKNIFFFRFMYPGTLNFVLSSNPCTRVHDVLFFLQIHVSGYMEFWFFFKSMYTGTWNLDFVSLLMCSSGGGGGPVQKIFFLFAKFFQHVKKLFNFWNFVKIKMAKFKLDHLGFYCKHSDRTIRKVRSNLITNWWDTLYVNPIC